MHHFSKRRSVASSSTSGGRIDVSPLQLAECCKMSPPAGPGRPPAPPHPPGRRILLGLGNRRRTASILVSTTAVLNCERTHLAKVGLVEKSTNVVGVLNVWARGTLAGGYLDGKSKERDLALAKHPSQAWPRGPNFFPPPFHTHLPQANAERAQNLLSVGLRWCYVHVGHRLAASFGVMLIIAWACWSERSKRKSPMNPNNFLDNEED